MYRLSLTSPHGLGLEDFLEANRPLSLRFLGTLAEQGELSVWVDDPRRPSLAAFASGGWLSTLGEPGAFLARLGELDALAAGLEESEGCLKLNALPKNLRAAMDGVRPLVREIGVGLFTLRPGDFSPAPEGPEVETLREGDAPAVAANSPYGHDAAYVAGCIRRAPSAAVRLGGELASYMLVHGNGSIGMLHTGERHRNRGLGRRVASALVERQLARGRDVYCYIVAGNAASERVFGSLGFRRAATVFWSVFRRGAGAHPGAGEGAG